MRKNKVERVALSGGLIGALFTNPKNAINKVITKENNDGWYCRQVMPHTTNNLFIRLLQIFILCITFFLWTFGAGYMVLFEKEENNNHNNNNEIIKQ